MTDLRAALRWSSERSIPGVLAASILAVAVLVGGPALLGRPPTHRYLLWNLALAWVPFVAALGIEGLSPARRRVLLAACGLAWLLFLPNAPYLLSDLSHLREPSATPWLDLSRFVAFAWAGCALGLASVRIVQRTVEARVGQAAGWVVVFVAAAASGIGIAIGRFARLNSWQVVTHPIVVASDALRLSSSHQAIAVAGFFSLLLLVMYLGLAAARRPQAG